MLTGVYSTTVGRENVMLPYIYTYVHLIYKDIYWNWFQFELRYLGLIDELCRRRVFAHLKRGPFQGAKQERHWNWKLSGKIRRKFIEPNSDMLMLLKMENFFDDWFAGMYRISSWTKFWCLERRLNWNLLKSNLYNLFDQRLLLYDSRFIKWLKNI